MVPARSFFAQTRGMRAAERRSCGMKARLSSPIPAAEGFAADREEERYKRILYGEKLWRWSVRVRWYRYVCCMKGMPCRMNIARLSVEKVDSAERVSASRDSFMKSTIIVLRVRGLDDWAVGDSRYQIMLVA
jgi:hypothetical protein